MIADVFTTSFFQFFADRAVTMIAVGGAEYVNVAGKAARIDNGGIDLWYKEWMTTACWAAERSNISAK